MSMLSPEAVAPPLRGGDPGPATGAAVDLTPAAAPAPAAPRYASAPGSTRWVMTLAAMTGVTALSIDMSLPAQPTLARVFGVSAETANLNLSLFILGYAITQLVSGYVSDAWGRRRVMLGGLALYAIAALACAVAPSIEVVLACRVLQGVGASAPPVVARAMVRDTQPAASAARLLSTMLATLALAPMIAPSIGAGVLALAGWRAVFGALAVTGVLLLALAYLTLPETLPAGRRQTASLPGLVRGYRTFFATPGTRLPMLLSMTSFAGQFAYIANSPFVLMQGYGVSTRTFAVLFGATAFAMMVGSVLGARMLRAGRAPRAMVGLGATVILVGAVLITPGTRIDGLGIAGFIVPMVLYFLGVGLASPSASALALEPCAPIAGTASAAIGFLTMTAGAAAGYLTTRIGGADPHVFSVVVTVMGATAAVIGIAAARSRRRRAT